MEESATTRHSGLPCTSTHAMCSICVPSDCGSVYFGLSGSLGDQSLGLAAAFILTLAPLTVALAAGALLAVAGPVSLIRWIRGRENRCLGCLKSPQIQRISCTAKSTARKAAKAPRITVVPAMMKAAASIQKVRMMNHLTR